MMDQSIAIRQVYCSSIRPVLEYASVVWSGIAKACADQLESIQRRAARLISGILLPSHLPHAVILARVGLPTLSSRRHVEQVVFAHNFVHGSLPNHLLDCLGHWTKQNPPGVPPFAMLLVSVCLALKRLSSSDLLSICHSLLGMPSL